MLRLGDGEGGGAAALLLRVGVDGVGQGVGLDARDGVGPDGGEGPGVVGDVLIGADVAGGTVDIGGGEVVELDVGF